MRRAILGAAAWREHGDSSPCHAYSSAIGHLRAALAFRPAMMFSSLFP
ncbi:hypothetical protein C4K22_1849 [Pseudomonas chlororaphis subsp. aurantiaca]|nr:hypothetical protein C4K24_1833 [Pseudomonas chlororaphis subsp. aurantiaca]AZD97765.1 hypothetical protein C4K12_1888 [Pseudomonas chlororaphis subsp. aureofaciens]AZD34603.1 hypothetical protein C4K22_1849 [Pseudomonas chlororaphis subsp. aurantiaca]AZD40938.1 hypothetical protein C4K21_1853 [Pseudomonas chlororaphis subsp. aurantiaca]AZD53712.1 hypothetical protein C4K19_1914 [Pseudomonas chlororaphis subsp. aurantiaca]